jgi:hypothetical protein
MLGSTGRMGLLANSAGEDKDMNTKENNNEQLKKILQNLKAFIQSEAKSSDDHLSIETTSIIFRNDNDALKEPTTFLAQVQSGIHFLDSMNATTLKHFKLDIGTDFNAWSFDDIKELSVFFSVFTKYPLVITVDSKQIDSLDNDKLTALLQAMATTTVGKIRIARLYTSEKEKDIPSISLDKFLVIQSILPNAAIEQARYFDAHRSLTTNLIYAERIGGIRVINKEEAANKESPNKEVAPQEDEQQRSSISPRR